jgi:hypothetical protein
MLRMGTMSVPYRIGYAETAKLIISDMCVFLSVGLGKRLRGAPVMLEGSTAWRLRMINETSSQSEMRRRKLSLLRPTVLGRSICSEGTTSHNGESDDSV